MALYSGAVVDKLPGHKYLDALRFFEFSPRPPRPRPATLTRLRHGFPEGTVASLRAPLSALVSEQGPLRPGEAQQALFRWTLDAADSLDVRALVLPTPAELMPSPRSRELLARLADSLPRTKPRHYIWLPRGAWEAEEAAAVAQELGLVCAFDPLQQSRPPGSVVYARLVAMGAQTGFSDGTLEDVLDMLGREPYDEAFVVIDAPRASQHATRLQHINRGHKSF